MIIIHDKKINFSLYNLLLGILFLLLGIISFINPSANLAAITIIFGIIPIIRGIVDFVIRSKISNHFGIKVSYLTVRAILNILLGILIISFSNIWSMVIPYLFAIWFISDSISGLLSLDFAKKVSKKLYWFVLIMNILGLVLGIVLLFNPIISALSLSFIIGIYFITAAITNFVEAFSK